MNSWESLDKMVKKEIIRKEFSKKPTELSICKIHVKILEALNFSIKQIKQDLYSEIIDEDSKKSIVIGAACSRVDKYIERAVQTMSLYEQSIITIKIPLDDKGINYDLLSLEVMLKEVEFYKPIWQWSLDEKYNVALKYKDNGVELFKAKRHMDAYYRFSKACKILITLEPLDFNAPILKDVWNLRHILYNNMAECHLIRKNYGHVLTLCSKILNKENHNVKALYRRGVAYGNLKDYENAVNDLKNAIFFDPKNAKAQEQFNIYNELWKVSVQRYQDIVRKMFKTK
ncbi:PREDICTED: FK506-binding protein-like [Ceratosolen solmsi marchali]|uniref:FK506-binding protein-like n=1 Tax=Ceratosolen solmsi marchali TaxID=326594 RepID=A0AAJ6YDT6_9HYME|nr:PREDICTED: FK506-binding protein-like [Ceratosolen solmsi marchali]